MYRERHSPHALHSNKRQADGSHSQRLLEEVMSPTELRRYYIMVLFYVFINDLPLSIKSASMTMYVDDYMVSCAAD